MQNIVFGKPQTKAKCFVKQSKKGDKMFHIN